MKQKLFTLLTLLVLCVTGAWAGSETIDCSSASATSSTGNTNKHSSTNYSAYFTRGGGGWSVNSGKGYQGKTDAIAVFKITQPAEVKIIISNSGNSNRTFTATAKPFKTVELGDEFLSILDCSYTNSYKYADCVSSSKNYAGLETTSVYYNQTSASDYCTLNNPQLSTTTSYTTGEQTLNASATSVEYLISSSLPAGVYAIGFSAASNSNVSFAGIKFTTTASYSVTYKANNGTEEADVTDNSASTIADCPNTWTVPTGKMFSGWNTAANGSGDAYAVGATVTGALTLYAQWADAYTVTFNLQGHGSAIAAQNIVSGGKVTEPATPTADDGYLFRGWYKESACTNAWDFDNDVVSAATELFAKWVEATTLFSMTDITGPTDGIAHGGKDDVTATFSSGASAEVYNGHGSSDAIFVVGSTMNLNSSGGSYLHITLPTAIQAGDVISFGDLTGAIKVGAETNSSKASTKSFPYTITESDASLIGSKDLYFFKDGSATFTSVTVQGEGLIANLTVTSSTTPNVTKGETSAITYTSSSDGNVSYSTKDAGVATVSDAGVITAVSSGTAVITISQEATATYRSDVATITVTVPETAIIKARLSGKTTATVTGTIGGTYNGSTQDVDKTNGGCKLGSKGTWAGITLAGENTLQTGDVVEVRITAQNGSTYFVFYDSKEQTNVILETEVAPTPGIHRFVLPAAANGVASIFLVRGTDDTGNTGFNPTVDYIAVYRPDAVVTLNISGFATYSKGSDYKYEGATAYKMALNTSTSTLSGTALSADTKIAAGEGILLKGEASAPIAIFATTGAEALEDNDLKGTTLANGSLASKGTANYYVLSGNEFKKYTGAAFAENKAYLESATELSSKLSLIFDDDETTSINNIANGQQPIANSQVYNLAGQKVSESYKGIVIVNGRKFVRK